MAESVMNAIIIIENREAVRQELIYRAYVKGEGDTTFI